MRRSIPLRVFVAGATGVIGRALVPLLTSVGHDVTALSRTPGPGRAAAVWSHPAGRLRCRKGRAASLTSLVRRHEDHARAGGRRSRS
ncbi:NAD-dependent epimerase/dehydratase family protein [Streptomyces avermitilis]|uniref:NAD-dependent epimerase/dehydratase family protein n=1 Tax=Streptomyces avermitilis TaxID=33903 RepID=UPI0033AB4ACA